MTTFDLYYFTDQGSRFMCCTIDRGDHALTIGPFPAKKAGPLIVDALLAEPNLFTDRKSAEQAYIIAHFANKTRGRNDAGRAYPSHHRPTKPKRVYDETPPAPLTVCSKCHRPTITGLACLFCET